MVFFVTVEKIIPQTRRVYEGGYGNDAKFHIEPNGFILSLDKFAMVLETDPGFAPGTKLKFTVEEVKE